MFQIPLIIEISDGLHVWLTNMWDALRDFVLLAQFKNVKNTHGGVLLLVKLQVSDSSTGIFHVF